MSRIYGVVTFYAQFYLTLAGNTQSSVARALRARARGKGSGGSGAGVEGGTRTNDG